MQITNEAIQANPKIFKQLNMQSYEFFNPDKPKNPSIYQVQPKLDKAKTGQDQQLCYLKTSFFRSLIMYKPAVTILVFDWQN
jgi:hypothetical protein